MLLLALCLIAILANAQEQQPAAKAAFNNFSAEIAIDPAALLIAMEANKGEQVNIPLSKEFSFNGNVISNENVYDNLQTIIIKSADYNNAVMQISKQTINNTISYTGRIFGQGSTDGYHIKKDADGNYQLQKFELALIRQDCKQ
jgi:hypothetical protein